MSPVTTANLARRASRITAKHPFHRTALTKLPLHTTGEVEGLMYTDASLASPAHKWMMRASFATWVAVIGFLGWTGWREIKGYTPKGGKEWVSGSGEEKKD